MLKETLLQAAQAGAQVMKMYFEQHFSVAFKNEGMNNLVTEVDTKSEAAIIEVIKKNTPHPCYFK